MGIKAHKDKISVQKLVAKQSGIHRDVKLFMGIYGVKALAKLEKRYALSRFGKESVEAARHMFLGRSFHIVYPSVKNYPV